MGAMHDDCSQGSWAEGVQQWGLPKAQRSLGPLVVGRAAAKLPEARRVVGVAGVVVELGGYAGGVTALPRVRVAEGPDVALHAR